MIIFVSGLIGAGKSTVARALAKAYELHYYDVDEVKKVVYRKDPDYQRNMQQGIPFSDETRTKLYDNVIEALKNLSGQHQCIVVDETLHKREMRHRLFDAAEKYFGGYIVIWVKADEAVIRQRLTANARSGHILKDPMSMHNTMLAEFEGFERPVIVCRNNYDIDVTVQDMNRFFSTVLNLAKAVTEKQL